MNNTDKQQYFNTFLRTFLVALAIVLFCVADLAINVDQKRTKTTTKDESVNTGLDIQRLYYLEKQNPSDYTINLKLAVLHQLVKEYDKARINYKKALIKSNNAPFAVYKAAMFFAEQKEYQNAFNLILLLPDVQNKKYYEMRARFYSRLAKSFLSDHDYSNAIKTYKLSYKYAKNTNNKLKNQVLKDYARAYSDFADVFISENNLPLAKRVLENAIELFDDGYAYYKLALLYKDVDNEKALKYIEHAYELDPDIVNLDLYYYLLNELLKQAEASGKAPSVKYYTLKIENFQRKILSNNIYKNDIIIANISVKEYNKIPFMSKKPVLNFTLKNNSKLPISGLYVMVKVSAMATSKQSFQVKAVDENRSLPPGGVLNNVSIPISELASQAVLNQAVINFYARKNVRSHWVLINSLKPNIVN